MFLSINSIFKHKKFLTKIYMKFLFENILVKKLFFILTCTFFMLYDILIFISSNIYYQFVLACLLIID